MATTQILTDKAMLSEIEHCLCGQPRCLGHKRKDGEIYVPGFTSQEAKDACPEEIVIFDHPLKPHVHAAIASAS